MMPRGGGGAARSWRSQGAPGRGRAVHHGGRGETTCPPRGLQRGQRHPRAPRAEETGRGGGGRKSSLAWFSENRRTVLVAQSSQIRLHTRAQVSVGSKPKEQCQRKQDHVNRTSFSCLFHSDSALHAYFSLCCWEGRGPRH